MVWNSSDTYSPDAVYIKPPLVYFCPFSFPHKSFLPFSFSFISTIIPEPFFHTHTHRATAPHPYSFRWAHTGYTHRLSSFKFPRHTTLGSFVALLHAIVGSNLIYVYLFSFFTLWTTVNGLWWQAAVDWLRQMLYIFILGTRLLLHF